MKQTIYFKISSLLIPVVFLLILLFSCNEDDFLTEIPKDFFSPENAYVTYQDFDAAVLNLYNRYRSFIFEGTGDANFNNLSWSLTELAYPNQGRWNNVQNILLPTNSGVIYNGLWMPMYQLIYDANVVIGRVDGDNNDLTDNQKKKIKAEALFFRAYAHKLLANVFGGVPIVLEETKEPKRDYVRATQQEVFEQCVTDLVFAVNNLPDIDETDLTRLSNLAASHLVTEVYLNLARWDEAINAATAVIDHPSTGIMTERFGNKISNPLLLGFNEDPDFDGDVYWDLFFTGNQTRSVGNTEAIWIMPFEYNVPGGGDGAYGIRCQMPRTWQLKAINNNGSQTQIIPHPNENYGGRGGGFIRPSRYFEFELWNKSGEGDIRNAPHNIIRDWIIRNPASDHVGKWLIKDNVPFPYTSATDSMRDYYPAVAKGSTFGTFPKELLIENQSVPGSVGQTAPNTRTWKDQYAIRLAETYLLRAEAYLGKGDHGRAANDINVIRNRSQAPEIDASMVDVDYILDEHMRELHFEQLYLVTLQRAGMTVERSRKYDYQLGSTYLDHFNLWPIPYDDIEKNIEAVLEQNPGY